MTISILNGMLTVKLLSLGIRRNRGKVTEAVVFVAVGEVFEGFSYEPGHGLVWALSGVETGCVAGVSRLWRRCTEI